MKTTEVCERIRAIAEPLVSARGLVIWGIELVSAGKQCLRVYIDTPQEPHQQACGDSCEASPTSDFLAPSAGAALSQCEAIAKDLGVALDVEDLFPSAWLLEVSTPGLSRRFFALAQMRGYCGDVVEAKLRQSLPKENGRSFWRGILRSVSERDFTLTPVVITETENVAVEPHTANMTIPWDVTERVSRRALFPLPEKPGKGPKQ